MPFDAPSLWPCSPWGWAGHANPPWDESLGAGRAARSMPALHPPPQGVVASDLLRFTGKQEIHASSVWENGHDRFSTFKSSPAFHGPDRAAEKGVHGVCEDACVCVGEVQVATSQHTDNPRSLGES